MEFTDIKVLPKDNNSQKKKIFFSANKMVIYRAIIFLSFVKMVNLEKGVEKILRPVNNNYCSSHIINMIFIEDLIISISPRLNHYSTKIKKK